MQLQVHSGSTGAVSLANLKPEQMTRVLNNNRNLGAAIDLVGCYLKNYEIDKADRVCQRIEPLCRERGGLWLFKFLNMYVTVKMKQARFHEALAMYDEYEQLIGMEPEEQWELFDTVYRNFGWIHCSMGNHEKAMHYFRRCVEIKKKNGVPPHWFDQWDLGKTHARLSLQKGNIQALAHSLELIKKGIELHQQVEQQDRVMLCKMLNSAGECATVLGDYAEYEDSRPWYEEAVRLHRRSYDIYVVVLGKRKPLTGWCMEHLAGALRKLDTPESREEAKGLLLDALFVECSKDIIKLSAMERLLGSILEVHQETGDLEGLCRCQESINIGLDNLHRRKVNEVESASYAALLRRIAQVLLAHSPEANRQGALALLEEALGYAEQAVGHSSGGQHAEVSRMLEYLAGLKEGAAAETWQEDRESPIFMPKAGDQRIADVDARALLVDLRGLVARLRAGPLCSPANATANAVVADTVPNVPASSSSSVPGPQPESPNASHHQGAAPSQAPVAGAMGATDAMDATDLMGAVGGAGATSPSRTSSGGISYYGSTLGAAAQRSHRQSVPPVVVTASGPEWNPRGEARPPSQPKAPLAQEWERIDDGEECEVVD